MPKLSTLTLKIRSLKLMLYMDRRTHEQNLMNYAFYPLGMAPAQE